MSHAKYKKLLKLLKSKKAEIEKANEIYYGHPYRFYMTSSQEKEFNKVFEDAIKFK